MLIRYQPNRKQEENPEAQPWGVSGGPVVKKKKPTYNAGDAASIPGLARSPEKGMATRSSILAWRMARTEEPGGIRFMGSQRARYNLVMKQQQNPGAKPRAMPATPARVPSSLPGSQTAKSMGNKTALPRYSVNV